MNNINHFEQSLAQTLWLPSSFKRTLSCGKSVAFLVKMVLNLWPQSFTKCPKNSKMKILNWILKGLVSSDLSRRQLHKWEKSYRLFSFWTSQLRGATTHVLLIYVLYNARSRAAVFFFASRSTERRKKDYSLSSNEVKSRFLEISIDMWH